LTDFLGEEPIGPFGRANERPELRGADEVRPDFVDHLERARKRIAELRQMHGDDDEEESFRDRWYVEAPPGWSYEWKTHSVWNKEYPQYYNTLLRRGWAAVPASRHRNLLYPEYADESIVIEGMVLMERPKELTDRQRLRDIRKAADQVRNSEIKLTEAPPGTPSRSENPITRPRIRAHVGPVDIA
jgi:hypothetical protein